MRSAVEANRPPIQSNWDASMPALTSTPVRIAMTGRSPESARPLPSGRKSDVFEQEVEEARVG